MNSFGERQPEEQDPGLATTSPSQSATTDPDPADEPEAREKDTGDPEAAGGLDETTDTGSRRSTRDDTEADARDRALQEENAATSLDQPSEG